MLMRIDPLREIDRLAHQFLGTTQTGTWSNPAAIPLDAYRDGDRFVVAFDLPGVDPQAIDIDVERNVLTVKAERRPLLAGDDAKVQVSERPLGAFARRMFLSDALDTDSIQATYENGVLVLTFPIAERARPRRIEVSSNRTPRAIDA